jgi:hypothetical protein
MFQRRIADCRVLFQRSENLHLAILVCFGFSAREFARERIFMGEIINP